MADFRIWATINHTAPLEYVVTVSGVPDDPDSCECPHISMRSTTSRTQAVESAADLVLQMGQLLRQGGHRVVDVEDEL
jgi:hypothetical protein